jgi:carbamoyltransferase
MKNDPWICGISASPHNGAVCLLKGSEIFVAIQEERLSRRKRDGIRGAHPSLSLSYCLEYAGIKPSELSLVVCCVTNRAKNPVQDVTLNPILETKLHNIPTLYIPHHLGHAVSAFATSGFRESAILIVDGVGSPVEDLTKEECDVCKWPVEDGYETVSLYGASESSFTPLEKHLAANGKWLQAHGIGMPLFGSFGGMYGAVASQIFGDIFEAGKVMGLAPYGRPEIPTHDFFDIVDGRFVFHNTVPNRFQHAEHWPLRQKEYENLAASTQAALEEGLMYLAQHLHELCPSPNLCYAGGVALNSVFNEMLVRDSAFKNLYFMPAAEDSGTAIGAAYYGLWQLTGKNSARKLIHDAVGRNYSLCEISKAIKKIPGVQQLDSTDPISAAVDLLCEGKIIGWFQGRSELGPRALGQRSILCDPRRPDGKAVLNMRVKHREAFRPFAPVILLEEAKNWFELDGQSPESPFMLRVCKFREDRKQEVPAVVHVDDTGRFQTLTKEANGQLYELVKKFHEKTGVPILLNTSFNVMGEPIVETPEDALLTFLSTGLDYCFLEGQLVEKRKEILFELNETAWPLRMNELVSSSLKAASIAKTNGDGNGQGRLGPTHPLQEYTGTFEHPAHGTLTIEVENGNLKGTFAGGLIMFRRYSTWSSPLQHYCHDIFEVVAQPFKGYQVLFIPDVKGNIDCVAFLVKKAFSRDIIFIRTSKTETDRNAIEKFTGMYEDSGRLMNVSLGEGNKLIAIVPGQSELELTRRNGTEFNLKNIPGYNIAFEIDFSGICRGLTVTQPNGIFKLNKR